MATASVYSGPGFDFTNEVRYVCSEREQCRDTDLELRNNFLTERGIPLPKATSTGTTIVGCLFKDGVILGADTRATEGPIVADKNCEKVRAPPGLVHTAVYTSSMIDPLYYRQHPMLRCRNSSRYGIHDRPHLF